MGILDIIFSYFHVNLLILIVRDNTLHEEREIVQRGSDTFMSNFSKSLSDLARIFSIFWPPLLQVFPLF